MSSNENITPKVRLYNAISLDGFIAKLDGDSDWVSEADWEPFENEMNEAGCIIVGRKTFDQYQGNLYPVAAVTNIVMTKNPDLVGNQDNVIHTDKSPKEILQIASDLGHERVLLIGGGSANAAFLEAGLIDEVIVSIHPLILGNGIGLFESTEQFKDLEKVSVNQLDEGLVKLEYKVKK